jgi:hypothetical protein
VKEHQKATELLKDPIFRPVTDIGMDEFRELTLERVKKIASSGLVRIQDMVTEPLKFLGLQELVVMADV